MRSTRLIFGIALLAFAGIGCSSADSPNPTGSGGSAGSDGGGGAGGADTGATGFTAVPPCNAQTDYMTGTMVSFKLMEASYTPKCLKVSKGAMVTFVADGGTFADHPLKPSAKRGDRTNNPITMIADGTMKAFTFPEAGYFAYFCATHGFSDTGSGSMMDGVVWVTP